MNYAMYAVSDITKNQQLQKEHNIVKLEQQEFVYVFCFSASTLQEKCQTFKKIPVQDQFYIYTF